MYTFSHGIHPRDAKEATAAAPIRRLPFAPYLVILLSQHAGRPAKAIVRDGQRVARGELIAEANGHISAPIHAPATGIIKKVGTALDFNGKMAPAIILMPDPGSPQDRHDGSTPRSINDLSPEEIIRGVRDIGMVGLGGAAFPTHVKLAPPEGKVITTLILNGCECEPYLTSDHRVMVESPEAIIAGTHLLQKALHGAQAIIAIEANKPDAIAILRKACAGTDIVVQGVQTKYPQGAEKMLTRALLNQDIPSGGLPADIGCVISNIATAAEIGTLLPRGQGLIERVVTVTGAGVKRPGNYLIPIGTPLNFLLDQVGMETPARRVIFGGPMMGKGVTFLETPITKGCSGIVVMDDNECPKETKTYPCIKCAECVNVCPIHLNPSTLGMLARKNQFDTMAETFHLFDCFECGCCSFVCPSNIPLVQYFRLAKEVVRKRKAAA